jgi:simple sugar transport system ATP-binding protein
MPEPGAPGTEGRGAAAAAPVLELRGITKRFGDLIANDDVSLALAAGEMLALLGENGAGKTTLMNILFGHYTPEAGQVRVFGRVLPHGRPRAAIAAGVGMVHQHFTLAANLTVLDNIMIGTEPLGALRTDRAGARRRLEAIATRTGLAVEPDRRVGDLSVGERQRVEILKALYRDARILILDEPTAVLTQAEAAQLFANLRRMSRDGLGVIFISHKLQEVMEAADRIVVLRAGRVAGERRPAETSRAELAELMVGRRVDRPVRAPRAPGPVRLALADVALAEEGRTRLDGVSLEVREGEILGIAGVAGNGQDALGRVLSGLARPARGSVLVDGAPLAGGPAGAIARGIGRIPEDRLADGVVGEMAVWENATLERIGSSRFARAGFVRRAAGRSHAAGLIARYDVRGGGTDTRARLLSGGNIQKLILGRNLAEAPRILIAAQPTRGLDEGAIAAIHAALLAARDAGTAILLISEDLDEIIALSDRVQAMVRGRLSAAVPAAEADPQRIGLMMAGAWERAA